MSTFSLNFPKKKTIAFLLLHVLFKLHILRNLNFYVFYFKVLDEIQSGKKWKKKVEMLKHVLLFSSLYYLFFFLYQDKMNYLQNIALYNLIFMNNFEAYWNLAMCVFILFSRYLLDLMYNQNKGISATIISNMLLHQDNSFFIQESWKPKGLLPRILNQNEDFRKKNAAEKMCVVAVLICNAFQIMIVACNGKVLGKCFYIMFCL